jgi:hypothetical protein
MSTVMLSTAAEARVGWTTKAAATSAATISDERSFPGRRVVGLFRCTVYLA